MPVKNDTRPYRSPHRAAATEQTRARIIAAACTLLGGGMNLPQFSLDALARQAGGTRLTIYNQFESKRGLLEAGFDDLSHLGGLSEFPAVFADDDAKQALR